MHKILIVDDCDANRTLIRRTLIMLKKFEVIEAVNGIEAIGMFEKESPDLILMDINMPEMDGCQATTKIKELAGEEYTPIIFVTALSSESSLAEALASGGDDFISKPINIEVLQSKIDAHLRIRNLNQQLNEKNENLKSFSMNLMREQDLIEHFFERALHKSFLDEKYIKYHMSSMAAFSGDVLFASKRPGGGIYVLIGDFTGHGLTAAMGTLPVAMIFFKMASKGVDISAIARELNRQLNDLMPSSMFFSATMIEMNESGDKMSIWMGGMPEAYWFGSNGDFKGELDSKHMSLGILNDSSFDDAVDIIDIEKDDKLYLYTDGVTEAQNQDGVMFGDEKLKDTLISNGDERFDSVIDELGSFTGVGDQNDDITLVEVTCNIIPADNV